MSYPIPFMHAHSRSIPGGWGVSYPSGATMFRAEGPPQQVIDKICQFQKERGVFNSEYAVYLYCVRVWAQRAPDRFDPKMMPKDVGDSAMFSARKLMTVDDYGPIIWRMFYILHLNFDKDFFLAMINWVSGVLDPLNHDNDNTGCPMCFDHWVEYLKSSPPTKVRTREDMVRWVMTCHNNVRKSQGKNPFTYADMVEQFGAPYERLENADN